MVEPLYIMSFPPVPNFGLFCSTTNRFRDTKLSNFGNIGNVPNNVKMALNTLTVKSSLYTQSTYPTRPDFCPFRSTAYHVQDIAYIIPHWLPCLRSKRNQILSKYKISQLSPSLWVYTCAWIVSVNVLMCTFRGHVFGNFIPIWSYDNENEKQ